MNKILIYISLLFLQLLNAQSYSGIVEPIKKVNLSLATDGLIMSIKVKEGEKAKKNDVILTLNSKLQQLEVKRIKTSLDYNSRIFYLKKQILLVENMYKMSQELYKKTGSISKNELIGYELKFYNLKSELEEIKNNKIQEKVQYNLEKETLRLYTLRAPFAGVVTKINLDIGEWTTKGEAIVEFVDRTVCFVETNIPQNEIGNIKLNQKYTISIKKGDGFVKKQGKVTYISPIVDSSSGLVLIKIEFNNSSLDILPGVLATIEINKI